MQDTTRSSEAYKPMTDNTAWGDQLATELGKYAGAARMAWDLNSERYKDDLPKLIASAWKSAADMAFTASKMGRDTFTFKFRPATYGYDNYFPPWNHVHEALPADLRTMSDKGLLTIQANQEHLLYSFTLSWAFHTVRCHDTHKRLRQEVEDVQSFCNFPLTRRPAADRTFPRRQLATKAASRTLVIGQQSPPKKDEQSRAD